MASSNDRQTDRPLKKLLNNVVDVHKKDIWELSGGHLNESKLWMPEKKTRSPWPSATKSSHWLRKSHKLQDYPVRKGQLPPVDAKREVMADTVMNFMLGAAGGVPNIHPDKIKRTSRSPSSEGSFIDKEKKIPSDHNLIEELVLPELMLPVATKNASANKSRGQSQPEFTHEFVSTHHSLPTKTQQYRQMQDFERRRIRRHDAEKQHGFCGTYTIADIEKRLRNRLSKLERRHIVKRVPSFYGLQAYSDCWDELIEYSQTYGKILKDIKDVYDDYITTLLDSQKERNKGLYDQLDVLTARNTVSTEDVEAEEERVKNLEKQAKEVLEENESLRRQLKEENEKAEIAAIVAPEFQPSMRPPDKEKKKDLEEEVEDLHRQIEHLFYTINDLKRDQKENHVPIVICQRLEQCIKETEIDIQKLCKQNEFLEQNIEELEEELEQLLQSSGTHERDARILLKECSNKIESIYWKAYNPYLAV